MENATDALKIAFAVFVFTMALTIAITMFSQLNQVSKVVLSSSDITTFYEYNIVADEERSRTVGLETIIPTLYKYYQENYTVLFLDASGEPLPLYETKTVQTSWGSGTNRAVGTIGKYYTNDSNQYSIYDKKAVCTFDVNEEIIRHESWTGSISEYKKNLDDFLNGTNNYSNKSRFYRKIFE